MRVCTVLDSIIWCFVQKSQNHAVMFVSDFEIYLHNSISFHKFLFRPKNVKKITEMLRLFFSSVKLDCNEVSLKILIFRINLSAVVSAVLHCTGFIKGDVLKLCFSPKDFPRYSRVLIIFLKNLYPRRPKPLV